MPGPGGISQRRPPLFRSKREWPRVPRPGPDPTSWRCGGTRQPMGTEEVGLLAAVNLPGHGSAETGSARAAAPRAVGEEPRGWGRSRRATARGPLLAKAAED